MDTISSKSVENPEKALTVSIVVPAFNEEGNLSHLFEEISKALNPLDISWEIVFSEDGSSDGTWREIESLHQRFSQVKGIRFSRNFGHQYALLAGLMNAGGEAVVMMDADLQHPPEVIPLLIEEWKKGNKIVQTIRLDKEDTPFFKRVTSRYFYRLFTLLSGVHLQEGMADFRLLDRQVVADFVSLREQGLFLRGLIQWVGYPSAIVKFTPRDRFSGVSKYTLRKMVRFAWHGITSFSLIPLRLSIFIGLITGFLAFLELCYVVYIRVYTDAAVPGWASAVGLISILFCIQFILMGIFGEYLARILMEARNRPRFIISEDVGVGTVYKDV